MYRDAFLLLYRCGRSDFDWKVGIKWEKYRTLIVIFSLYQIIKINAIKSSNYK